MSANSRSKAVSLGLEGKSAEEEGWGRGQSTVRVMGREIPVLKRWAYEQELGNETGDTEGEESSSDPVGVPKSDEGPPLWGLDLEALRTSNTSAQHGNPPTSRTSLPIHIAQSARAYLMKSFATAVCLDDAKAVTPKTDSPLNSAAKKKPVSKSNSPAHKEHNLALLLQALDMLHASWAPVLGRDELDRRSWGWYVSVRPEVRLGEILKLRR